MKTILVIAIAIFITACGNSSDGGDVSGSINLSNLPVTAIATIEMDSSVEEGVDAFASFQNGSEEVMIAISKSVGAEGDIDIDNDFSGKVELTISGEHEISNAYTRIYSVSKIKKL